jgi:hypothetical protein
MQMRPLIYTNETNMCRSVLSTTVLHECRECCRESIRVARDCAASSPLYVSGNSISCYTVTAVPITNHQRTATTGYSNVSR